MMSLICRLLGHDWIDASENYMHSTRGQRPPAILTRRRFTICMRCRRRERETSEVIPIGA